ncbi:MAG: hypothetical protein UR68_C0033G0004 [Candidatus Roizmanbacteria bacterium GW2011_GWA2_35_19]|uniref:Peptidase S9 prolyl oligopeptidase catalytic domain-containing protein n=2 Tax=Candidatus Roizmaniibacteriota TaxID=1752723 RepID=A0A0G0EWN8_9BACT|nr:MAG: hypothetical protein UR63_C0027G0004 [Candidatus Roizmanbacteria bacterium GW2011_GWC2_35_12]KKP71532.1 MAG: hypothetical protein UR68_C0033G0004 [Candidatus Roizmanbacteria bacterium GW2011_GWA2_35_19]
MKKFSIKIDKNQKIVGVFYEGNKTLMIICNGYGGTKDFPSIKSLAEELYEKGFSTIRFNFSETGESGLKGISIKQQVDNINSLVDRFKSYKKIILIGGSLGAISSSIASILNPKISGLITINGFFDLPMLGKKFKKMYYQYRFLSVFHPKIRKDYMYLKEKFLPEKIKIPVLVICSKSDDEVLPIQSEIFYSKLKTKKKFVDLLTLRHDLMNPSDTKKVATTIAKHFTRQ